MDSEKKTFVMPILTVTDFKIDSIDKLNVSINILEDLTPWA